MSDPGLVPDDDVMHRFLCWWFSTCNRGVIELGWTDECSGKLNLFRRFDLDSIEQAARFAAETNARPGCNLYFRPATVKPDTQFTRDSDVVQIPGAWGDCDTAGSVNQTLGAGIVPSAEIITGRFPAIRAQFLWKYSDIPILLPDLSRELNRRVQILAGSDGAVVNPSTLLRLPGSIAWPWKEGRVPELTEWITPEGGHSVTIASLKARLPELMTAEPHNPKLNGAATADGLLNPCQALLEQARNGPLWHDPVLRAVAMMVSRGFPDWAILAMAEGITLPAYTAQQTRDELAKMIDGARRKGFGDSTDDVMDVPPKQSASGTGFPLLTDEALLAMPDPEWLIADFLTAGALSVLYGAFATFKSFLAIDFALCLATGTPWNGRAVTRCDVLYVAGEGIGGLKLRVAAWKLHHGITGSIGGFRVVPLAVNLMDKAEVAQLIATVTGAEGFDPKLVIVDTLARAMPGGDENSAKDISVPIRSAGMIQASLGCALMLIHHAGKDAERGLRGSTGLPGAADTVLRLKREGTSVTLEVEKQKDHDGGQILRLRSKVVELPLIPGSLKPRSSLVLVSGGGAAAKSGEALSHLERTARHFLVDLVAAEGTPLPQSGEGLRGVPAIRWREECESRGLSTAETRKSRGTVFRRTFQSLLDKNAVAVRDGIVWLINQEA